VNGTKYFEKLLTLWNTYVEAKSWKPDLEKNVAWFADEMRALHECRAQAQA